MNGTFVQVHYHNRRGGVAAVMERYSLAFCKACGKSASESLVLCSQEPASVGINFTGARVIDVKDCGYRKFRSGAAFVKVGGRLFYRLKRIIASGALASPVYVVGHNLNLGKNCALSWAFARLARYCVPSGNSYRFFSVLHDFAEDGRRDLIEQFLSLERYGIKIGEDLYPVSPNLCFVAINERNFSRLKKARLPVRLVPNPVIGPKTARPLPLSYCRRVVRTLADCAKKDKTAFNPNAPLLAYPSRTISRKNTVEAIVLSHFFFSANLLLGESGTSAADRALTARLKQLCGTYKIPVVFNSDRAVGSLPHVDDTPISLLTEIADACVSTSVIEGFGYALYEPWLYYKAVLGRVPVGSDVQKQIVAPGLYSMLFVPCGWVDVEKLADRYYRDMRNCCGKKNGVPGWDPFLKRFNREFVKEGGIDFGCLDSATQCAVFEGLCRFPHLVQEWKRAFPFQTQMIMNSWRDALQHPTPFAAANRKRILSLFGNRAFTASFSTCFEKTSLLLERVRRGPSALNKISCGLDTFRQLATPQFPGQKHFCKIIS
jgi:hypothetical protein